ncbi:MAG: T9SS type A sorting domain-containing protein [Chlorobi bacterium]|nr:T9SS type A sorting domain-containing protein [Chlorobiota bacterium]
MKKHLLLFLLSFAVLVVFAQNETSIVKKRITLKSFDSFAESGGSINYSTLKSSTADELEALFSADVASGQVPLKVQFTDESAGNPVSWEWDFNNDGVVDATEQNPLFTFTEAGIYTVKLVVSDGTGTDELIKTNYVTVTCVGVSSSAYVVNFESDEDLSAWRIIDANSDDKTWGVAQTYGIDGTDCIAYGYSSDNNADDWAISPCVKLEAGKCYEVKFYYAIESIDYPEKLELRYGTSPDASMGNQVVDLGEIYNETFEKSSTVISIRETNSYYFGWHCYSDADMYNLYIDSVSITELNSSTIVSTTEGGVWDDETTWIGGKVPEEYDDVIIDGNVEVTCCYKCKSLTVNENDTLIFGPAYNDIDFTVFNDVTVNGAVVGYPQGHTLTLITGGNIINNGYWQSVSVLFDGKYDNEINMSSTALFKYVRFLKNDAVSSIFLTSDGMFENCFFTNDDDSRFGISELPYNIEISGDGSVVVDFMRSTSLESINLNGNNNILKNASFYRRDNAPVTYAKDLHLDGSNYIGSDSVFFTDNVIVDGSLKTGSSEILNVSGTFINNGSITDETEIRSTGEIINNGDWNAYRVRMEGAGDQSFVNNNTLSLYFVLYAKVEGATTYKWYKDDVLIVNATDSTYITQDKSDPFGVYYCETDAGISRTITIENNDVTKVRNNRFIVSVYPNPVVDYVIVETNMNEISKICIYNINGILVKEASAGLNGATGINVLDLPHGTYLIKVLAGKNSFVKKIQIK